MQRFAVKALYVVVAVALAAAGVFAQQQGEAKKGRRGSPSGPPGVATFDVYADGGVLHVLAGHGRKGAPALTLWHMRSDDGGKGWAGPTRLNGADEAVVAPHPGENPQIAARGGQVIATWTARSPDGGRGGPIATALSTDGGKTWQRGPNPANDGSTRYHALLQIAAGERAFHMVWLHGHDGKQALHHAASADGGRTWQANHLLAAHTCNCCWNSIVTGPGAAVGVMYRGGIPRDMMFAASPDGTAWKDLGQVGKFDWDFNGCPHVGGALAASADGKRLHALVWTGQDRAVGLHHLASSDGGRSWSAPRRLGTEDAKDSDLAVAADGTLVAVWDTLEGAVTAVYRADSRDGGRTWSAPARLSTPEVSAHHPRVVASSRGTSVLWLEGAPGQPEVLRLDGAVVPVPVR